MKEENRIIASGYIYCNLSVKGEPEEMKGIIDFDMVFIREGKEEDGTLKFVANNEDITINEISVSKRNQIDDMKVSVKDLTVIANDYKSAFDYKVYKTVQEMIIENYFDIIWIDNETQKDKDMLE